MAPPDLYQLWLTANFSIDFAGQNPAVKLNQGLPVSSVPINLRCRSCLSSLVHKMDPMFTTAGPCLINKIIDHIYTVIYTCPILVYIVAYNFIYGAKESKNNPIDQSKEEIDG